MLLYLGRTPASAVDTTPIVLVVHRPLAFEHSLEHPNPHSILLFQNTTTAQTRPKATYGPALKPEKMPIRLLQIDLETALSNPSEPVN